MYAEQEDAPHDFEIMEWFQPAMREKLWGKVTTWIGQRFDK